MTKDLIVEDFEVLSNCSVEKLLKLKHKAQDYVRETEHEFSMAKDRQHEGNSKGTKHIAGSGQNDKGKFKTWIKWHLKKYTKGYSATHKLTIPTTARIVRMCL